MNRLLFLRERCDKYQGRRGSPYRSWVTEFNADKRENVRDAAKLALNTYNQKEQKNFNLEKVCKLNHIGPLLCMTFIAKNAETDECSLFRGGENKRHSRDMVHAGQRVLNVSIKWSGVLVEMC